MPDITSRTPEELVCEDIICSAMDGICLYVKIFKELPKSFADENDESLEYGQNNSFIVICDEDSELGRKASDFIIEFDELDRARNDDDPPGVAIGIMNKRELKWFNHYYSLKNEIKPNPFKEGFVSIVVISNASISIEISLDYLAPPK